jgi:hypothetical protein
MAKHYTYGVVLIGLAIVFAIVAALLAVHLMVDYLCTQDSWPPRDEQEEKAFIARYKKKLRMGDSPLSPRTPEDTACYLSRIIDYEVLKGERKVGREYILQAISEKLDNRVESLTTRSEAKDLIVKMRNGLKKRGDLARLIALYERRPGNTAAKELKEKFDQELTELSAQYCGIAFDPAACPELAEEIEKMYKAKLEPAKEDPRLKEVVAEFLGHQE